MPRNSRTTPGEGWHASETRRVLSRSDTMTWFCRLPQNASVAHTEAVLDKAPALRSDRPGLVEAGLHTVLRRPGIHHIAQSER